MKQMYYAKPESWLNVTGGGSGSSGIPSRSTNIRSAAALREDHSLLMASTQLGVPAANLSVLPRRCRSPAAGRPSPTAALLGGKLFNAQLTPPRTAVPRPPRSGNGPGLGNTKPVPRSTTVVGKSFARIDIPDKVARHLHLHPERPRSWDAARARAFGPAAPAPTPSRTIRR